MSKVSRRSRGERNAPYNPGVRELVQGKNKWSPAPVEQQKAGFKNWHERGYLPHRDRIGLTQFITFHVADSFPTALRAEWAHLLQIEDNLERRKKLEMYLDKGRGRCFLRQPENAALIESGLLFHHEAKYELKAWVIMPNHVHILIKIGSQPMGKIVKELKAYTGRKVNEMMNRRGAFWAVDFWDTYIREPDHELRVRRYIENNPVRARLCKQAANWTWSSARRRDKYGRLVL